MLCNRNVDINPRYPDKLIAPSNNTASGETYSLAFDSSIPAMHITTTKTFFSALTKFTDKT